jgi:hypothetical protein
MKTLLGKFFFLLHLSAIKDGTKLLGMDLKHLKKSKGFNLLAFLMLSKVFLALLDCT